jgi:hypothetical protein
MNIFSWLIQNCDHHGNGLRCFAYFRIFLKYILPDFFLSSGKIFYRLLGTNHVSLLKRIFCVSLEDNFLIKKNSSAIVMVVNMFINSLFKKKIVVRYSSFLPLFFLTRVKWTTYASLYDKWGVQSIVRYTCLLTPTLYFLSPPVDYM